MNKLGLVHSRAAWPPVVLVLIILCPYALVSLLIGMLGLKMSFNFGDMPEMAKLRVGVLAVGSGLYAMFRLWRFHPVYNFRHREWLAQVPWKPGWRMPLGPIYPVWQDMAVVGALAAAAHWHAHGDAGVPVAAYLGTYVLGLTVALGLMKARLHLLILAFLWPAIHLPGMTPLAGGILLFIIAGITWHGELWGLRSFPWKLPPFVADANINITIPGPTSATLGWPFQALNPKIKVPSMPWPRTIIASALVSWWMFCFTAAEPPAPNNFIFAVGSMAALARLAIYLSNVAAPLSFLGRIVTGRLIIPKFDQVLVIPLVLVAASFLGQELVKHSGAWFAAVQAGVVGVLLLITFGGGPSRQRWMLTAQVRLKRGAPSTGNRQEAGAMGAKA